MNETIAVQVARGAEWLDAVAPGWEHKVNTEALNMCTNCVIQQIYGAGKIAAIAFGNDAVTRGLGYDAGNLWLDRHAFLCTGRAEWIATIEARRAEQRAAVTEVNVETEVAV